MKSNKWLPLVAILLTSAACKKAESKSPTADPSAAAPAEKAAAPAKPIAMRNAATMKMAATAKMAAPAAATGAQPEGAQSPVKVSKERYDITVDTPAGVAGADSVVTVTLTPKKGWHVNQDFPTKLTVTPPAGVTVAKDKLKKADAKVFNNNTASFAVNYKAAAAGSKSFGAVFKFAVCSAATCDPKTEKLAWNVSVK